MLLTPHFLEAGDGRRRETWRVLADEGRQRFLEVAARDALQVEDRDQELWPKFGDGLKDQAAAWA